MASSHRYWLALHPDIRNPIGGAKQMHRFAEAISACGRQATLIQDELIFIQAGSKARCPQSHFLSGNNARTSTLRLMSW